MTSVYDKINDLEEFVIIGGTPVTLNFECYDENGTPLNLGGAGILYRVSEYGNPSNVVIAKNGSILSANFAKVELVASDTINLSGKFVQQPIIVDSTNVQHPNSQGLITIIPRIQQ